MVVLKVISEGDRSLSDSGVSLNGIVVEKAPEKLSTTGGDIFQSVIPSEWEWGERIVPILLVTQHLRKEKPHVRKWKNHA